MSGGAWRGEQVAANREHPVEKLGIYIATVGILGPVAIWAFQAYVWLRFAIWQPMPISVAWVFLTLPWPHVEWAGLQILLDRLLDLPLAGALLPLILIGVVLAAWGSELRLAAPRPPR